MTGLDGQYQKVLDDLAEEFLQRSLEELADQPNYGSITRQMDGHDLSVAYWHYEIDDDIDHIVFVLSRRLLVPFFHRKFISGLVFGLTTEPRLMTDEEAGAYD